ncbi:hypothetical protein B0H14DRAFT_3128356 [Mycena olivaceomarginata]|nr:hypothetical protein B0H14DRAFT_3128356 [Mycena olivaceomarginata]
MAHHPQCRPPPRYIRRLPACLCRALGHALDQVNPPAIDRAVQRIRLSTNPLARMSQMLSLMELGPRAYEQEGPGVLYIQFRSAQFKVGHTDCLPRRLEEYHRDLGVLPHAQSKALRAGYTPASKLPRCEGPFLALLRVQYQALRILLVLPCRRPLNDPTYHQTGNLAHRWDRWRCRYRTLPYIVFCSSGPPQQAQGWRPSLHHAVRL